MATEEDEGTEDGSGYGILLALDDYTETIYTIAKKHTNWSSSGAVITIWRRAIQPRLGKFGLVFDLDKIRAVIRIETKLGIGGNIGQPFGGGDVRVGIFCTAFFTRYIEVVAHGTIS